MSSTSLTRTPLPPDLVQEISECGFYPDLVADAIASGLPEGQVLGHLVHHEAAFNGHEIQRHLTVLVLTERQLLISHTDDGDQTAPDRALTTAEVVATRAIDNVVVTRSVERPERYQGDSQVAEAWLSISWGGNRRLDLTPAVCEDPDCEADHGYTGMAGPNDITVRMSSAGDGTHHTRGLLAFGALLQRRVG